LPEDIKKNRRGDRENDLVGATETTQQWLAMRAIAKFHGRGLEEEREESSRSWSESGCSESPMSASGACWVLLALLSHGNAILEVGSLGNWFGKFRGSLIDA